MTEQEINKTIEKVEVRMSNFLKGFTLSYHLDSHPNYPAYKIQMKAESRDSKSFVQDSYSIPKEVVKTYTEEILEHIILDMLKRLITTYFKRP